MIPILRQKTAFFEDDRRLRRISIRRVRSISARASLRPILLADVSSHERYPWSLAVDESFDDVAFGDLADGLFELAEIDGFGEMDGESSRVAQLDVGGRPET
jgi:hypothetical protein